MQTRASKWSPATHSIRWVTQTHEILQRWSFDDERPSDRDELDSIRSGLNELGPVFGRPLLLGRTAKQNEQDLGRKVDHLSTDLETERDRVRDLDKTVSDLSSHLKTLDETIVRQAEEAQQRDTQIQALNQDIVRQAGLVERRDAEIEGLSATNTERELQVDSLMRAVNERGQPHRRPAAILELAPDGAATQVQSRAELAEKQIASPRPDCRLA